MTVRLYDFSQKRAIARIQQPALRKANRSRLQLLTRNLLATLELIRFAESQLPFSIGLFGEATALTCISSKRITLENQYRTVPKLALTPDILMLKTVTFSRFTSHPTALLVPLTAF